jgi:hypothetical protein
VSAGLARPKAPLPGRPRGAGRVGSLVGGRQLVARQRTGTRRGASEGDLEGVEVVGAAEPGVGQVGGAGLVPVGADHGAGRILGHDDDGLVGGALADTARPANGSTRPSPS